VNSPERNEYSKKISEKRSQSDAVSVPREKTGEGGRQSVSEQSRREREIGGPVLDRSDAEHALVGLVLLHRLLWKHLRTTALQKCTAVPRRARI